MKRKGLTDWAHTSGSLHRAAGTMGVQNKTLVEPRPNYLHLPLQIRPWGLASSPLPNGAAVSLDFKEGKLRYLGTSGKELTLSLVEHTQASLFGTLLPALKADGLEEALRGVEGQLPAGGFDASEFLRLDTDTAAAYADLQYAVFTGIARFRAGLEGTMTPVIVWPHHMDISTLWFHPSNKDANEDGPHLNFGMAPFTTGQYELPYLYAYAHPYPVPFEAPDLPHPARWHTEGWRGAVVGFDALFGAGDTAGFVEEVFSGVHAALGPLLEG